MVGNYQSMSSGVIWDMKVFMHELGHNFGAGEFDFEGYHAPIHDKSTTRPSIIFETHFFSFLRSTIKATLMTPARMNPQLTRVAVATLVTTATALAFLPYQSPAQSCRIVICGKKNQVSEKSDRLLRLTSPMYIHTIASSLSNLTQRRYASH